MAEFSSLELINEIADFLQVSTSIGTVATDIFIGFMPSSPVVCTAVYAQPGISLMGDPLVRPGVQVLARGITYSSVHQMAEIIFGVLQDVWNISASGSARGRLSASHEVGPNYRDGNNNIVFTLNFSFIGTRIVG